MEAFSKQIIEKAIERNIPLEKNLSSMEHKFYYREEFWKMVPDNAKIIYGYDAHSLAEVEEKWKKLNKH